MFLLSTYSKFEMDMTNFTYPVVLISNDFECFKIILSDSLKYPCLSIIGCSSHLHIGLNCVYFLTKFSETIISVMLTINNVPFSKLSIGTDDMLHITSNLIQFQQCVASICTDPINIAMYNILMNHYYPCDSQLTIQNHVVPVAPPSPPAIPTPTPLFEKENVEKYLVSDDCSSTKKRKRKNKGVKDNKRSPKKVCGAEVASKEEANKVIEVNHVNEVDDVANDDIIDDILKDIEYDLDDSLFNQSFEISNNASSARDEIDDMLDRILSEM